MAEHVAGKGINNEVGVVLSGCGRVMGVVVPKIGFEKLATMPPPHTHTPVLDQ